MQLKDTMRFIVLGGIFILPFIPLLITGFTFFPFITGKNFAFRMVVEVILVAWIILALLDTQYRPRWSWLWGSFLSFVGIMFVANMMSESIFKSMWSNFERMEGWVTLAHLAALLMVMASVMLKEKLWIWLINVSIGVSAWMSMIGFKELSDYYFRDIGNWRIDATFGNPTYFAIYIVFHLFLTALFLYRNWQGHVAIRIFYSVALLLQFAMLYFTATRGAILGFIGGAALAAFVLAVFDPWRKSAEKPKWFSSRPLLLAVVPITALGSVGAFLLSLSPTIIWGLAAVLVVVLLLPLFDSHRSLISKIAFGAVLLLVALIGSFVLAKDTAFVQNSDVLNRFAQISPTGGGVQSRLTIWAMAWEGVKERPILGWGQESFNFVFNKYYDPIMYNQEPWFDRTHNVILDWLISGGFVGLIAYLAIPLVLMYYLWIYKRDDHPMDIVERALITGLIAAYFFHNLFVFDNLTSWILYVFILAYVHVRLTKDNTPLWTDKKVPADTTRLLIAPVLLVVLLSFIYFANIRGLMVSADLVTALRVVAQNDFERAHELYEHAESKNFIGRQEVAEQYVQTAARVLQSGAPEELKQLYRQEATSAMEAQIARVPNDARTLLFMGSFLSAVGDLNQSITYLERARQSSPKKQVILLELGSRYVTLNRIEDAQAVFREAYELEPAFLDARELYALSLLYTATSTDEIKYLFVDENDESLTKSEKYYVNATGTMIFDDDRYMRTLQSRGFHDEVIAVLTERLQRNPEVGQAYVSLAAGYLGAGNREQAIELIERAIEINPAFAEQGQEFIEQIESGEVGPENTQ